jgi:hypothetical protein
VDVDPVTAARLIQSPKISDDDADLAACLLCLQLSNLKHQTCVDQLTHLQQLLQLTPSQATQLVLRLPQLLIYAPAKLDRLFQGLAELVQGQDKAKELVLKSPKVCDSRGKRRRAQAHGVDDGSK